MSYEALATDAAFAAVPPLRRQMRDGSVDKTETYKPLSGKVMLGHWLKWKLWANIYTSLTGPSRICRAVWAAYSDGAFRPCTHPRRCPGTRPEGEAADFGAVIKNKKNLSCSDGEAESNPNSWNSTAREEKVKDVEFLNCINGGSWRLPVSG